jgi:hypothetical protein
MQHYVVPPPPAFVSGGHSVYRGAYPAYRPRGVPAWFAVCASFALMLVLAAILCAFGTIAAFALLDGRDPAEATPAALIRR